MYLSVKENHYCRDKSGLKDVFLDIFKNRAIAGGLTRGIYQQCAI